ncbi:non-ribosomal peptide synthase/polyketide synthase (plasmid) [Bradyrhizobium sp. CCGUVB1N3]|nr:non-ribosomal peptide synthase/polyketide synthase [Bradyrhizobium sp. CCGUVB1N3]MCP3478013.1 non-ribosomal peptide synthase/polyketide synthase [Bradyrhizobium sp. CCGUVB1N3]
MTDLVRTELEKLDAEGLSKLLLLAKKGDGSESRTATLIPKVGREEPLALSFAQQRLWFLAQLDETGTHYHVPLAWRLEGVLDRSAWQRSLDCLLARHEALRSIFVADEGRPRVEVLPPDMPLPVLQHDLRDRVDAEAALSDLCHEEARAPFDLARGPLIRGRLIRMSDEEHVFLLTQHHIVSDGWSLGVLVRELSQLYRAFVAGEDDPLPPLAIQYPDYAAWQRQWLSGERLSNQAQYWRNALSGAPARLALPTDRPRPAEQSFAGASVPVVIDADLTRDLRRLSRQHGTTLFMTVLAAWAAVLSRLSGQDDIVIGVPSANRGRGEIEELIGFFVNTLALRLDLSGEPSVLQLLERTRRTALAAQEHQDLPFEQVVEIVKPPRHLDHTPLFQVMLAWQNNAVRSFDLAGLSVEAAGEGLDQVKFDLELSLGECDEVITGRFDYATALFDEATIERQRGYLLALLRAMVADAGQPVGRIDILPADERAYLLEELNRTAAAYPSERCIHELFEAQVAKTPDAVAVVHEDERVSYGELNARANRLAHHLIARGVKPDQPVAICLQRSVAMVVGLLAILKAGGAYLPLDPTYPSARLKQVLNDAAPPLLLADAAGRSALGAAALADVNVVALDTAMPVWANLPASDPDPRALGLTSRHLAYVIYTSGSTGMPKGVMVEHKSAVNLLHWSGGVFAPSEISRMLFSTSISFDLSVYECFVPLSQGSTLYLVENALALAERPLDVSMINTVPSAIASLVDKKAVPASTSVVNLAGEPLKAGLIEKIFESSHVQKICNLYAPSETTTYSTWICMPRGDAVVETIGRPIANTQVYLLDGHGAPVPFGAVGELYIGGAGVARGYLNRPALTAERFIASPFVEGDRLYRTGDLARYLPDGNLEFLGRSDDQVKIRGFRIEPGEIAARLVEHASVREAAVVAREDRSGEKRLVAYVVTADEDAGEAEAAELAGTLRTHLGARLPEYMVPSAFVRLAVLPLTVNGKLDRKALPAPEDDAYARRTYEAPRGEIETALAQIWAELLGLERVGRHDNFFELGGHSLLAVRLLSRVSQAVGLALPLTTLFAKPVLADLAESIVDELSRSGPQELPAIVAVSREEPLVLSFAQQRLWFLAQLDETGTHYHVPLAWRLEGVLDRSAWQRSLDRLLARHEALRSVFVASEEEPWVEVSSPDAGLPVIEHDLQGRPDAEAALSDLCHEEARAPFDLARGPLIRGRLIRMSDEEHVFLLTQHHIVSDGWSLGVLVRELSQLYRAFVAGEDDPLPPLAIQYPDYAAWQRQWLSGERLSNQAQYWRNALSGAPARLALPTDRPRPAEQSFAGASVPVVIDADLTRDLRRLSRQHGTTLFMTVLAAWAAVLSRLSGQDDIVIGVPSANRGRGEIEGLIGFFVNTLALRLDLSGEPSVLQLLERTRRTALAAQEHQDLPFEQVVEIVQPPRRLDHTPLFQVGLAWQNNAVRSFDLAGLNVEAAGDGYDQVKFDLELNLSERGEVIAGTLGYATALFDEATIERQRGYLLALLRAMVADAGQPVGRIDILPADERSYLLEELNRTAAAYPSERCIHELFEAQVAKTPDAVAVVHEDERVSYGELNARANRLAHHLIARGVKPDQPVAICLQRSVAMVVGLLAILKAGGAYLPLDPTYPSARLKQVLNDAAPPLLLADAAGRSALGAAALADVNVVALDTAMPVWANLPASDPDPRALGLTSRHLAYVIYTSGSTGMPKGVMVEHKSAVNLLHWSGGVFAPSEISRMLFSTSISFDLSVYECFVPLSQGSTLYLVENALALAERPLDVSMINTVPSAIASLVDKKAVPASTSVVNLAGEPLKAGLIEKIFESSHVQKICNLYAPSETTTYSTWICMPRGDAVVETIGRPIANTQVYLLDGHGAPVPFGAVGELYIGGAGVARGYLNRPALTAERFIASPFVEGDRLYRTGDLARYLPDGNLEFLGRSDDQVKIRGFRIEPGEIAARLVEHASVREAAVVAREDRSGEKRLVAYVVTADEDAGEAEAAELAGTLRTHLGARLPEYMVPSAFVRLAVLPLTVNGKLDRKALPAPEDDAYARRTYEAPRGEIETALAQIWAELLGLERVGRHDNFFELGGHSLLAVRLLSRVSQAVGLALPLTTLFAKPVLADLAESIVDELSRSGPQELPAIVAVSREEPLVLSFAQQRLWFLAQLDETGTHYHVPLAWRLEGVLDRSAWQRSLDRLLARHEALRSVFVASEEEPWVEVSSPDAGLPVIEHDLQGRPDAEAALSDLCHEEARAPFDLARGPLIRGRLIRMSDEEHVFLLTQHHIVSDGWSLGVLVRELSQLYRAFVAGEDDPLPPLAIQYPDYAAWQRQWLSGERLSNQAQYWRNALSGAPARLALPTDRPRPAEQSFAGASVPVVIDADLTRDLRRLSRQHGTTLFMTVLAAWAAVLSRLSGQDDIVIGVPSANRGRGEIEGLIGFFVNTLALRLDLSGEPSVLQLLERTRRTALAAQEHQDLPFEQVVEIVQPPRRLDHTPLFQVGLAWQNNAVRSFDLAGLSVEAAGEGLDQVKFDLELSLGECDEVITGRFDYATALFDEATIERQRGYLLALLRAMVADAGQPVGRIDILPADERAYLLEELNRTAAAYPSERCIHELFEAQVAKTPDAVAVVHEDERVSYGELNARANRLAHHLIARGVKPDQPVAICLQRSVAMVVGLLAILKAGGAYLPLDPTYPSARLKQVLNDAAPPLLLADAAGRSALGAAALADVNVVALDTAMPVWANLPASDPDPRALGLTSRHLAYVIYTSGSTGSPKGVMVEHRGMVNYLCWACHAYAPRSSSVVSSPVAFDATINSLFAPLIHGGYADLLTEGDEVEGLKAKISSECGLINITPNHLDALGQQMLADTAASQVGTFIIGGEALSHSTVELWRRIQPTARMVNEYGPTETVVGCIFHDIATELTLATNVPIGRPIANTQVYLLDGHGAPVPFGAVGELYIGGAGVARGYLNRPALTAERFIASPFVEGDRLYRTGDLARYLPDGNLEFLGRSDDQVKIRGFRIEPGEIAARLVEHASVREAAVVAREDRSGEKRLVAYVVTADEDAGEAEAAELAGTLRTHLGARLPEYMVPSAFVRLAVLPLTVNGKLDRKALPAPEDDAYARRTYEAPRGEIETALAQIWAELLGLERVGRHDNFFELGGHSLLAVQLMERLRRLSLGIEVRTLFAKPVLADLAVSLGSHHEVTVPANLITERSTAITPQMLPLIELAQGEIDRIVATVPGGLSNVQDIYALSPLQDGILFHHLLASRGDPYLLVSQMAFAHRGLLERYLAAVQRVVDRHDILRTSFVWEGLSGPAQVVWRNAPLEVTEVELDASAGPGPEQLRRRFDPRQHRIDLGLAPLLRFVIAREPSSGRWLLLQLQHHLIGDHTTSEVMHAEVQAALDGREHELRAPQPFRNLVAQTRLGVDAKAHEEFFRSWLADIDAPTTPFGLSEVRGDGSGVGEARRMLPQELNDRLRAQARRLGVSLASLCHLAWGQVVARSSGREQVVFGTVLFGRMQGGAGADRAMGLFMNTLPLRLDLDGTGVEASVRTTHRRLAELLAHEHASLALAQRCSRVATPAPLFSALLNYRHNTPAAISEPDDVLSGMEWLSGEERTNYPLTLSVEDFGEALGLTADAAEPVCPDRVCGYMQRALAQLAEALERTPNMPVRELDILPADERAYLLEELNRTAAAYPSERCIHELFEAQVAKTPDAVAVVHEDERVSYGELNARANRLAHHLIARGVKPDQPVAICLQRSVAMVVGLLAILKAGGAYLPLDPTYPSARLKQVLNDAAPPLLLADAAGRSALGAAALADVNVVALDTAMPVWANLPASDPDPRALGLSSRHLAYVIYTSGSTGMPKGVMVEHRGMVRLVAGNDFVEISPQDVFLNASSPTFDATTFEVWGGLANGASVVLYPERYPSTATLAQTIQDQGVTIAWMTARLFDVYVGEGCSINRLQHLLVGGEEVSVVSIRACQNRYPMLRISNGYGPTENTTFSLCYLVPADFDNQKRVPLGRPIRNSVAYLLDERLQPVPLGAVGEIYVGGAGVARGYLNRPALTAERFIASPFVEGDRLYRTGDLARYLPDGNLEFLGRSDDQVKIRGFRIEPGEIAARLVEHASVREAAVVAREDRSGEKRLVAYVVTADEDAGEAEAAELAGTLRTHLGARLPEYMVPSAFVRLAVLPLTVNGKLDRKALPAPEDDAYARRTYEAPRGEIETALAQIWAELLGLERVGRHDNFFELGGHSLLAVQLMERLRRLSLGIEVRTLFAKPVLADLAVSLGSHHEVTVPANLITERSTAITPQMLPLIELAQGEIDRIVATVPGGLSNVQDIYALSPLQDGILFHHLLASRGDPYLLVSQMAFAHRGLLERYLAAVQRVVDRHDILRTSFVWEGLSGPAQVVWRNAPLEVTEVELDASAGPGPEQLRRRFDPRQHRIDLGLAPLLRFVIAREPSSGRWLLLQLQHHLIGDHTTSEVMHAEVQAALDGREHELRAPQPFRNLVAQTRLGVDAKAHEEFFRSWLADIDAPTTPFGLSEVRGDGSGVGEARRMLPQELNDRLRAQARRLGVSLASLCHLAWGQVVARSSGREQVVFGTVLFGRMQGGAGADRAMGLFMNTLPLRLDLDGTGVEASVRTTHRRLAELLAHEHASLALAQRCSRVATPAPLFSALLNYRHNTPAAISEPDDVLSGMEWLSGEERTNYPLTLSVEDFGEALGLTADAAEPVCPDRVCGYMQRALAQLAEALERTPNMPVRELDILPADERSYLLEELNRTAAAYPSERCIHELFEAQVAKTPDAVAVVHEDERVSYGELNARANRLAHHLIARGVKPDQPVAICLQRSVAMVVGLLAILKAGGAYLPLDPTYPSARLKQVLNDAAPPLLLADAAGRSALGAAALADVNVVALDTAMPVWANLPASDPDPRALGLTSRHLAYVIYTSGSTGMPKGVMVEHKSAVNLLHWSGGVFAPSEISRMLFSTSISFDLSVYECFVPLSQGSTLYLVENALALAERPLDVSMINTVPSAIASLVDKKAVPASTSVVNLAGEPLKAGLIEKIFESSHVQKICNLYAPSETTTYSTWICMPRGDAVVETIGRPIANTQVYLLDGHGAPVPFGAVGELYIGGAGVARGYLNRPALTAERFIASPFVEGDRLYRTGDLARYLPDGNLEFLGRSDDQVKIRGFRIEPGEIAARLVEHASVREAAVVAREDRSGEKRLVAYVVTADEDAGEAEAAELAGTLRTHLGARLPEYMVPSAFVRLAVLPLTVNGKLDRKALPAPEDDAYARRTYEAPRGEIETALAQIWAELLGLERVGRHDNFFELGGHSLLAVRLLSRARDLGLQFSAADLFQTPSLKELAARVELDPHRHPAGVLSVRVMGSQPPLFFVPTGLGDYSYVLSLAQEMDIDCPVYALPWSSFDELYPPTLEAIAAQVISVIKEIQPKGPYRFAGYSSGAILAYAIAQRLLSIDETVSFMAFIDVTLPANPLSMSQAQIVLEMVLDPLESLDDERFKVLEGFAGEGSIAQLLEKAQQVGAMPLSRDFHSDYLMYEKIAQFQRALQLYQMPALSVKVHQFYATEPLLSRRARQAESSMDREASSPMRGWDQVLNAEAIHVVPIPGNHMTMMSVPENRRVLARSLSTALNSSPTTYLCNNKRSDMES